MPDPALAILAEAIVRLEYKLDLMMTILGFGQGVFPRMDFIGQVCPACKLNIEYQIDITSQVVKRVCGCKSGKQPFIPPTIPTPEGPQNGNPSRHDAGPAGDEGAPRPKDRHRGQGR